MTNPRDITPGQIYWHSRLRVEVEVIDLAPRLTVKLLQSSEERLGKAAGWKEGEIYKASPEFLTFRQEGWENIDLGEDPGC